MAVSRKRHLLKALSYRVLGSCFNATVGYTLTGDVKIGGAIGVADFAFKIILYYVHERVWYRFIRLGINDNDYRE